MNQVDHEPYFSYQLTILKIAALQGWEGGTEEEVWKVRKSEKKVEKQPSSGTRSVAAATWSSDPSPSLIGPEVSNLKKYMYTDKYINQIWSASSVHYYQERWG